MIRGEIPDGNVPVLARRKHVSRVLRPTASVSPNITSPQQYHEPHTRQRLDVSIEHSNRLLHIESPDNEDPVRPASRDIASSRVELSEERRGWE
jgi:hypothetical protein